MPRHARIHGSRHSRTGLAPHVRGVRACAVLRRSAARKSRPASPGPWRSCGNASSIPSLSRPLCPGTRVVGEQSPRQRHKAVLSAAASIPANSDRLARLRFAALAALCDSAALRRQKMAMPRNRWFADFDMPIGASWSNASLRYIGNTWYNQTTCPLNGKRPGGSVSHHRWHGGRCRPICPPLPSSRQSPASCAARTATKCVE